MNYSKRWRRQRRQNSERIASIEPPQNCVHVSNTRFTLVMNEAKAHIALHVSEFYILLCILPALCVYVWIGIGMCIRMSCPHRTG